MVFYRYLIHPVQAEKRTDLVQFWSAVRENFSGPGFEAGATRFVTY
jgi:hypothetical protein